MVRARLVNLLKPRWQCPLKDAGRTSLSCACILKAERRVATRHCYCAQARDTRALSPSRRAGWLPVPVGRSDAISPAIKCWLGPLLYSRSVAGPRVGILIPGAELPHVIQRLTRIARVCAGEVLVESGLRVSAGRLPLLVLRLEFLGDTCACERESQHVCAR